MLDSISRELDEINLPHYEGEVSMLPFDLGDLGTIPEFASVIKQMIQRLSNKTGEAHLTVHGANVKKGKSLRRPAPHIDGNYIENASWGKGGGNGWKVDQSGVLTPEEHKLSYQNDKGGMLIASNYSACRGWNGKYEGEAGEGGDCSHLELGASFMLRPDTVYYGNSQFIHESLPVIENVFRLFYRITLPINHVTLEIS